MFDYYQKIFLIYFDFQNQCSSLKKKKRAGGNVSENISMLKNIGFDWGRQCSFWSDWSISNMYGVTYTWRLNTEFKQLPYWYLYTASVFSICVKHHHHHVTLSARIFRTPSHHISISSIAFGRSSGLHPVSAQSSCMFIRAGRPAFARTCEGVHRSTSLTSSSLLLQQCPVYLVSLIFVTVVGGHTVAVLRGAVYRTCSILLAAFLCNCRQAFSAYVLLAST